ncbi:hypothetical protein CEY16_07040 [Halalkalibacillus sediminis]|uniref:Uncharacterized protein n=1 Tax=Halalkalibacillus sediminis TaxID=2018042 RepID=A0A2I0QTL5_9BACI|nr:hypothetical protein [Halalkalibacillus sediminis]PKR77681.1 hypothetical protein CEY16_07040 [Halalkalibacillus sediminis]
MSFGQHVVLLFIVLVLTGVLRVIQLKSFTRIDIFLWVFGPLLVLSFIMIFFALIDLKRTVFWDIGLNLFIYASIGIGGGIMWQRVIKRI